MDGRLKYGLGSFFIFASLCFMIILGGMGFGSLSINNTLSFNLKVDAVIDSVDFEYDGPPPGGLYYTYYYYKDENGIEYRGPASKGYEEESQALAQIGKKVTIYIDGKGNSTTMLNAIPMWKIALEFTGASIFILIIIGILLWFIIPLIPEIKGNIAIRRAQKFVNNNYFSEKSQQKRKEKEMEARQKAKAQKK